MTQPTENEKLEEKIVEIIKTCYDPELPVDIYELGLIYDILIDEKKFAHIKMTLTSPACPVAGSLPGEVKERIQSVEGLSGVKVDIVWDPPWTPEMMTDEARLELGLM